uniref:Uncharacterized protein n=1 Tax=Anguilla anguilla TaxID=7936 RepID=A0A0E9XJC2_ANGAN
MLRVDLKLDVICSALEQPKC